MRLECWNEIALLRRWADGSSNGAALLERWPHSVSGSRAQETGCRSTVDFKSRKISTPPRDRKTFWQIADVSALGWGIVIARLNETRSSCSDLANYEPS